MPATSSNLFRISVLDGAQEASYPYFDALSLRSDVDRALPLRSLVEIEGWSNNQLLSERHTFDEAHDSLRFTWSDGDGNVPTIQVAPQASSVNSGNWFFTWDERWGAAWNSVGDGSATNGIRTFKNYHVRQNAPYSGGGLMLEVRALLTGDSDVGDVPPEHACYVDIRSYFGNKGSGDRLNGKIGSIAVPTKQWVRYFLFLEYGGTGKISLWVTKPGAEPVPIYRQATGDSDGDPGPFERFVFQHNSSQYYTGNVSAHVWNRNLVVLNGVTDLNEAEELVALGSMA